MIDDDREDIEIFTSFLEAFDKTIELVTASHGQEGLEKIRHGAIRPDYIFLDLNMPRYDGFYFLKELRNLPERTNIPVIIFTTSSHPKDVERSRKLGASHFVTKPTDYSSMKDIISALLSGDDVAFARFTVY